MSAYLKFCGFIFIADVVADPEKLFVFVRAGQENHGHAHNVGHRDLGVIWGRGLEQKLVPTLGNRAHVDCV